MMTNSNNNMDLDLRISHPELREELEKHEEGEKRKVFAIKAMRIGVMAIHHAQGQIDAEKIQGEGNRIIEKTEATLDKFHQRIQDLIKQDGELEQIIRQQIDGDNSPLGKALTARNQTILDNFREQFNLNKGDSALSLLGNELQAKYNEFIKNLDQRIGSKKSSPKRSRQGQ